ncbi:protein phosphatase 1 regulatory subunit 3b [Plakobranchus ocellatus]|uniref:Protein phosphatase 1 regulatory subunit 3b n=1 Tax=Plakobranchus ocellatus TaxID=259542 RepID=A0AAV3Y2T6_9GAST|nr:protein phosphatase 1 regulatory subunit 3b [Plakobranchus ocellatus]
MYFCPCPCNDPLDPETEEAVRVALPRNLSYVQESYLDRYSVSACFVHNPKLEDSLRREQELAQAARVAACGPEAGSACAGTEERATPSHSFATGSSNAEDETVALLSILKPKEFSSERSFHSHFPAAGTADTSTSPGVPYRSNGSELASFNGGGFLSTSDNSVPFSYSKWTASSIGFLHDRGEGSVAQASLSPSSQPSTSFSSDETAVTCSGGEPSSHHLETSASPATTPVSSPLSVSPASLLLSPASRVASRLSALLHTPPNESMDAHRQGTSVDGDSLSAALSYTQNNSADPPPNLQAPDGLGQEMDRGEETSGISTSEDHPAHVDTEKSKSHVKPGEVTSSTSGPPRKSEGRDIKFTGRPYHPMVHSPDNGHLKTRQGTKEATGFYESPDSDGFSEEGVFVNMMDDLLVTDSGNSNSEGQCTASHADGDSDDDKSLSASVKSDETCLSVDSMFMSPEEGELEEDLSVAEKAVNPAVEVAEPARKMSLQEAISRAASDLSRMSMDLYGNEALQRDARDSKKEPHDGGGESPTEGRSNLASWGRSSPVKSGTGLKLAISEYSSSSSSSSEHLQRTELGSTELAADDDAQVESPVYAETEFNFSRQALRKSSSLKTNKTPPGTPHRKKAVRFADAMGLDLESVRHVLNTNSPPKIPPSAMADLLTGLSEDRKELGSKYLCPCFNQPGASDGFHQRVLGQKVCLENAIITDLTITGFVRVANITFHKSVRVRYTYNAWATFHDIAASYVQNSCDGPTDRFSFSLVAPAYFVPGHRLEFAVSFNAEGTEYWDNNFGQNYVFECFAKTVPTESESSWIHFL